MPVVIFTQAARLELIQEQDWYESEAAGLGRRFRNAVDALVSRISTNPTQFPVIYKEVRRAVLPRFPHSLFFVMDAENLVVIACFHASRSPVNWQKRT